MPRLRRLAVDLSSGSCGRDLLSGERGAVHVPADHGLAALHHLELRCFVWRHWEARSSRAGSSTDGSDAGSEGSSGTSDASSSDGSYGAASSDAGSEGSGSASQGGAASEAGEEAASDLSGADMDAEFEEAAEEVPAAGQEGPIAEPEEQAQGPGLLEASWGFLRSGRADGDATQQACAMLSLEQRQAHRCASPLAVHP